MYQQKLEHKNYVMFSMLFIFLGVFLFVYAGIIGRWNSLKALPIFLAALIVWLVWIIYLGWVQFVKSRNHRTKINLLPKLLLPLLISIVIIAGSHWIGQFLGKSLCFYEVRRAINAGLQADCAKLLSIWPAKSDRIYNSSSEFTQLPFSIKMLSPIYIINDNIADTNSYPSISLCKNGFGGFAVGIRVFRNDGEANKFITAMQVIMKFNKEFGCQRIAPGIYYWWQNT